MLPFLSGAQAEGRKFGGSFLLGYHGASQLRTTYGYDGATKLSNLASTRLFLRQPEEADASYASKNIGDSEIEEVISLIVAPLKKLAGINNLQVILVEDPYPNAFTDGAKTIYVAPKTVSGLVVKTVIYSD